MYVRPSRRRSAGGLFHVVPRRSAGILLGDYQNCMQEGNKKAGALQRCEGTGSQSLQLGSTRTAAVNRFCSATSLNTQVSTHCTEVRFASFLSGGFTTMAVINPPERKLAKRTYVHCVRRLRLARRQPSPSLCVLLLQ